MRRRQQLKELAALVADIATGRTDYRPTITEATWGEGADEIADAFDSAMAAVGIPVRAWRGVVGRRAA